MANAKKKAKQKFLDQLKQEDEKKIKEVERTLEKLKVVYVNRKDK